MAKNCIICGEKISAFGNSFGLYDGQTYVGEYCDSCSKLFEPANLDDLESNKEIALRKLDSNYPGASYKNAVISRFDKKIAQRDGDRDFERRLNNMLITTTPNVEGYEITDYLGVVFGDTVFKQDTIDVLSARLDNFFTSFAFSAKELTGSVGLIDEARDYAMAKLKYQAAKVGANAIVSLDVELNTGGQVSFVAINGTAVKIRKL